jgi:hypothetical protein
MTRARDVADTQDNVGGVLPPFTAGKNKIINGDFAINQRSFSSSTTSLTYGFDRWFFAGDDGTTTYSAQTFTLGTAPVAGYESANFARVASTGQTATNARSALVQRVESVRTLAGQTATISFWAKAASGTPSVALELIQNFGSGGSPSAQVTGIAATKVAITTTWARYSITVAVPSISGKTIGTTANTDFLGVQFYTSAGSDYNARTGTLGIQTATIDIWGVQLEAGSVATPFTTATGTIAGELAAASRYYYRFAASSTYSVFGAGNAYSTTGITAQFPLPVSMRVAPTSVDYSNIGVTQNFGGGTASISAVSLNSAYQSTSAAHPTITSTGLTSGTNYFIGANNNSAGYIGFSAEL